MWQLAGCSTGASIGCLKDDPSVTYDSARVRIGERYGVKSVGSLRQRVICLLNPVVSTIGRSENDTGPAQLEAGNRSIIRVGERNAIKSFGRSARLGRPGIAAVGRSENHASIADSGSGISIGKRNFEKADRSRVCLVYPGAATISCSKNGAFSADSARSAYRCSRIRINKGNTK